MAPSPLRYSVCCSDAVVMMGKNPDNRASWMADQVMSVIGRVYEGKA